MDIRLKSFLSYDFWSGDTTSAALELIDRIAHKKNVQHVVTLNAEMMLSAIDHPKVFDAIRASDFMVIDTISVFWWMKLMGKKCSRITGVDLATSLISQKSCRVALIGGASDHVRVEASKFVNSCGSQVVFLENGPRILNIDEEIPIGVDLESLLLSRPNVILVGFGHGKQERWISTVKKFITYPCVIIGVGGTIDLWGGKVRRAPSFMRAIGLEWLWRLILEPSRLPRIIQATIIFPCRALLETLL